MSAEPSVSLLVIYTTRWDECVAFYGDLGLPLVSEQHGSGPVHVAAQIGNGLVLEIYPEAEPERATGRLRLELTVPTSASGRDVGRHRLTDPDGRVVVLHVEPVDDPHDIPASL